MEVGRLVKHKTVAVAQYVGREPAVQAQAARAYDGGETALYQRLTRLEVLAGDRQFLLLGKLPHGRNVDGGVGSAHDEWSILLQGGIGVAHRGGDVHGVVGLHGSLEGSQCAVILHVGGNVNLGRSGPEHNHAVHTSLLLEVAYVFAYLLSHVPAVLAVFHVVAIETLGIVLVEGSLEGLDVDKLIFHRLDIFGLQHLGVACALIGIDGIHIPSAKHDVVEVGQGHDIFVVQIFLVGAAAHAYFVVLGHRAHGLAQTLAHHQHASHECCTHGTQSNYHDAKFTCSRFYI